MKVYGDSEREGCPVCGGTLVGAWRIPFAPLSAPVVVNGASTGFFPTLDPEAKLYCWSICAECGSVCLAPHAGWADKDSYRASTFHVRKYDTGEELSGYRAQFEQWIRPWLRSSDGAVLDAAAGCSQYLDFVAEVLPVAHRLAIELSGPSVAHMKARGIDAIQDDLDSASPALKFTVPSGFVDFVIFSEAFEHVYSPRRAMSFLRNRLRPGGRMFFTAQAIDGALPIRPGEPIYASRIGLDKMLVRLGVKVLRCELEAGRWKVVCEA